METVATRNKRACGNGEKPLSVCGHMIVKVGLFHWVTISDNPNNYQEHYVKYFTTKKQAELYVVSKKKQR